MSTTLFFLVPIGLLAVAWSFCFVGCVLQTGGVGFTPYSDSIIADASQTGLIAYWPLSDLIGAGGTPGTLNIKGQTQGAGDIFDGHNGTYTIPPAYPSGMMSDPVVTPFLKREPSIVPGDKGSTKNALAASVDFEGGFVTIPWSTQNPPTLTGFTLEAWFALDPAGSGFRRALFAAIIPGDTAGFAILIDENNDWQLAVGNSMGGSTFNTGVPAVDSSYVAVTFDSTNQTLSLWTNLQQSDVPNPPPPPAWPPPGSPPTNYVAAAPSQLTQIFIGAGATEETPRTVDGGMGAPLFPFMGQIQSVALYGTPLSATTIQDHFTNGSTG